MEYLNPYERVRVIKSSQTEDQEKAFDMKFASDGSIAIRSRRIAFNKYKDITLRSQSPHDHKTEVDKLKEGFGQVYIYGWEYGKDWIFFDIEGLRKYKLLEIQRKQFKNEDGHKFISIKVHELYFHNLIIDCSQRVVVSVFKNI